MTKTREPKTRRAQKPKSRLLKKLAVKSTGKSGGRNSGGRITSFHRGGGTKRLQRSIDLKRNTPSTGVVERIEYDPNRSSRVALVRWIDGVNLLRRRHVDQSQPSDEKVTASAFSVSESFKFNTLPDNFFSIGAGGGKNVISSQSKCLGKDYVMIGGVPKKFFSFGVGGGGNLATTASFESVPRIVVAGARPKYFAVEKMGEDLIGKNTTLSEIEKWKSKSLDRKYAIPWQSITLSEKRPEGSNLLPTQLVTFGLSRNKSIFNRNVLPKIPLGNNGLKDCVPVSYITASDKLKEGSTVMNCDWSKPTRGQSASSGLQDVSYERLDINSQIGNCIPLKDIRMGTFVHDIECRPGQGAKLVRAAGTYAKVIKEQDSKCLIRLPSGVEKLLDSSCRATVGVVSNPDHGMQKLRKAGQKRWLGRRPVVRGVAMNPVDHPHGGGEGRTKGGRPSVSPWGKPTKAGFKTVLKVVGKGRG